MRDNFDRSFNLIKYFIIGVFVLMAGVFIFRISYAVGHTNGKMYNITIPSMSNTAPDEYFATEYVEKNGCITFKDEFGFEHKHCGAYSVTKW